MSEHKELTPAQEALVAELREKWTALGLSTEPANRAEAEEGIREAYRTAGYEAPPIVWATSPRHGAQIAAERCEEGDGDVRSKMRNSLYAAFIPVNEVHWIAFYEFFRREGYVNETDCVQGLSKIAANCGWVFFYDGLAIACERPNVFKLDMDGRPHNPVGPAIGWADGWGIYYWRGFEVPREWIEEKDKLDPAEALSNPNAEERRVLSEIIGWEKILEKVNAKVLQQDKFGTLMAADLPEAPDSRFVRVTCGTGRTFVLPVPETVATAHAAVAWTYGYDNPEDYQPEGRS